MVKVSQVLRELQIKLAELEVKNTQLEARLKELEHPVAAVPALPAKPQALKPAPVPAPVPPVEEAISEEIMLVIAAAVAAYLGERAHIRVVRLAPSQAWAQQGRVSIQASHHLV